MHPDRVRVFSKGKQGPGPTVYWMSRDQRAHRNWALLHARELALRDHEPLVVVFCLAPGFLGAAMRQYRFMLEGLREAEAALTKKNIPFVLLTGPPEKTLPDFLDSVNAGILVTDFDPLRIKAEWKKLVAAATSLPIYEVDAHNVVPCWIASAKEEWAAYTFRPRIRRLLPDFLDEFPPLRKHPHTYGAGLLENDWGGIGKWLKADRSVPEADWIQPGRKAAVRALRRFVTKKLETYDERRNDPNAGGQSDLSPYLHFGQLSAQEVVLAVSASTLSETAKEAFLEELIVRRELSDNFCFYNSAYDRFEGFPRWARETLDRHRKDPREYYYSLEELEGAMTHDPLWNAAQSEMVIRGKMHGYMRMYWAKKILEWTRSPEEALERAIYLNDRYELDGRDPNGYVGIAWSIGGVHDRAWKERPVFGKIRYMGSPGAARKFDTATYIEKNSKIRF